MLPQLIARQLSRTRPGLSLAGRSGAWSYPPPIEPRTSRPHREKSSTMRSHAKSFHLFVALAILLTSAPAPMGASARAAQPRIVDEATPVSRDLLPADRLALPGPKTDFLLADAGIAQAKKETWQ
jgi:hypothetical protein